MPLLEDVDSIFTSPLEQPDSLPLTPAHDPGSFGHYRSTRRWADYSDDESLGSPMSLPSRKIPTDIDVKVEDPEGIEEGNSLRMSEMERQEDDQDVDHFHLDESSVGHDLPLRPPPQCPPPQPQMKGVSLIQSDINGSSCALPSHLDDHLHHQPIESHHEPQQIPHSTPSHQVMKLLIAQPTLSLVTYTREENKTVLASTQLNVMSWEDYPAPKISTVERSMKLVSSTRKSFVVPVVKSDSQGGTSLSSTQNDSLSKSETEAQSSAQASSGKKSKKRSKKSTNAGPSNEPQKRKVEGLVETWLRYDKEKQSTAAATRRRTLKSTSASLLFSEPLQTLEESRQMEDDRDVWNDRLSMYYVQKFCTYIGSVDLLVGGIQVKEVAKMVFGGRFQTSKNALVPRAPPSVSCFQKGLGLGLSMDLGIESNDVGNEEDDDDEKCWSMHWSTDENRVKVVLVEIPGEDTWWPRSIKDFATP
ncbi:hypothetical protein FRC03_007979 [Tulasnella sp. 419]|nr:hypothetical protein FRC03_007979 [Tulasnella sp. 419]